MGLLSIYSIYIYGGNMRAEGTVNSISASQEGGKVVIHFVIASDDKLLLSCEVRGYKIH